MNTLSFSWGDNGYFKAVIQSVGGTDQEFEQMMQGQLSDERLSSLMECMKHASFVLYNSQPMGHG